MNKEAWPGSQYSLPWQIRTCSCMTQLPGVRRNGPLHSKATHFLPQGTVYIVHTVQNMITRMWIVKHAYSEVPDVKQIWCVMNVIFLNIWYSKFIIQFQTIWSNTDFAVNINLLSVLVVTLFYHTGNLSWNVCVYRTIDSYHMCKWILYQIIFSTNLSWLDIRDCKHLAELTVNKYSC